MLSNDPATTTDSVIRITWPEPFYGGSAILDYEIQYDQGNGVYTVIETGWTNLYYQTDFAISSGTTYKFKVTTRNFYGSSPESDELSVLAAKEPNAPINL